MLLSRRGSISIVSFPIWTVPKPNGTSSPHLAYAGGRQDIFTDKALDDIYKESTGIPRRINRICEKSLMYASQQGKRLIDEHLVHYIIEHEMLGGDTCQ